MSGDVKVDVRNGKGKCRAVTSGTTALTADAHDGPWSEVQIIEDDTAFSVLTNSLNAGDALTGRNFKEGMVLYGNFTAVTRSAGAFILYK